MSFLTSIASLAIAQNKQALAQSIVIDKKTAQQVAKWTNRQIGTYWKPLLAVTAGASLAMGGYKLYSAIKEEQRQQSIAPTTSETERLGLAVEGIEYGKQLDSGMFEELELLANDYISELELEDCLVADETQLNINKWMDPKHEMKIREVHEKEMELITEMEGCGDKYTSVEIDEVRDRIESQFNIDLEDYQRKLFKKNRKRVGRNMLSPAVKALTAKIRSSFPQPDGSQLQQKAMSLYAAKECRKLQMRESESAFLIPKAVTLASIPTTSQVDLRLISKIQPVQLKYNKMAWSGFKNKSTWLSKLASSLPTLH